MVVAVSAVPAARSGRSLGSGSGRPQVAMRLRGLAQVTGEAEWLLSIVHPNTVGEG